MAHIAAVREHAQQVNAERAAERDARLRAERAAFTGSCFPCRDTGYAPGELGYCTCPRGVALAQQQRQHAVRAILEGANIPPRCAGFTLETYPAQDSPALALLCAFIDGWDDQQSLLLRGGYGTGKTGLAVATLKALAPYYAERGSPITRPLFFTTAADLLERLRRGYEDHSNDALLDHVCRVRVLTIDDLGAEKHSEWVLDRLFTIFNARYDNCLPTIVTTNYGAGQLVARIGERVANRLLEAYTVIDVNGPNWRRRASEAQGGPLS
ncbi:MAG TPA: ATP-binding protein [Ktedonobacterales bacterium]|nr:ATP-binding protein [Ktedonobacterales bacterium]